MSDKVTAFPPVDYQVSTFERLVITCASGATIVAQKATGGSDCVEVEITRPHKDEDELYSRSTYFSIGRADLQELVTALQHSGVFRDDTV